MLYKYNRKQIGIWVYLLHVLVRLYLELNDDTSEIMRIENQEVIAINEYIQNCIHRYRIVVEDYEYGIQLDELQVHPWVF